MKIPRTRAALVVVAALWFAAAIYGWFFFGIFSDREFGSLCLFSKHKPSPRFYFYSPIGESDILPSALPLDQRQAEFAFHEFIERNGGYHRRLRISK